MPSSTSPASRARVMTAHVVHNNNVTANYNALCVAVELGIMKRTRFLAAPMRVAALG